MRYEAYITTDLPWLTEVPRHWNFKNINSIFDERRTKVSDKDYQPLSVTKNGIMLQLENVAKSNDSENRKKILEGDFVINSRSDRKGSSGLSNYKGSVSLINIVLSARVGHGKYWHYLMKSTGFQEEFYRNGKGIVADLWSTNFQAMKNIVLPVPPIHEQEQIANFLDWKVNEIDRLINIEKKKKNLLSSIKDSKIKRLCNYGVLEPTQFQTIDNYIFEKIPARWSIRTISQISEENKTKNSDMLETNLLSLSYGNIVRRNIYTTFGLLPASFSTYQIVEKGMVILRFTDLQNDHKSLRVGLANERGIITSAYIALKLTDEIIPEYLYYTLHSYDICKGFYGMGAGVRQSLGFEEFKRMYIPLPSKNEQQAIVDECVKIKEEISSENKIIDEYIEELQNLKISLISEVVTGKINVQEIEVPKYDAVVLEIDEVLENLDISMEEGEEEWD